jgi:hypothetical protein
MLDILPARHIMCCVYIKELVTSQEKKAWP